MRTSLCLPLAALVTVLLGHATAPAQVAFTPPHAAPGGAIADVNGDGLLDVVTKAFNAPEVHLGLEDGGFAPPLGSTGPMTQGHWHLGDLDGDGRADLVEPHDLLPPHAALTVRRGEATGTFAPAQTVLLPHEPGDIHLSDVQGDGALDLVVVPAVAWEGPLTGRLTVVLGHGDGSFDAAQEVGAFDLLAPNVRLGFGDLNGDGRGDIVLNTRQGPSGPLPGITVLPGLGGAAFGAPVQLSTTASSSLVVGDLFGSGRDAVLFPLSDAVGVLTLSAHASPVETTIAVPGMDVAHSLELGQVVSGGALEIVISGAVRNTVLLADAAGRFTAAPDFWLPAAVELVTDADRDGAADLVTGSGHAFGRGDGSFETRHGLPAAALALATADLDGDGRADLLTCFGPAAPSQLRRGRMLGGLEPPVDMDLGPAPVAARLLDVAGGPAPDVLTLHDAGHGTEKLLGVSAGLGDGSVAPVVLTPVGDAAGMAVADFDADGLPDVVVWPETRVLLNAGDGHWVTQAVPSSLQVLGAGAGDFDADGLADLVRLVRQPANLLMQEVLLGQGDGSFVPLPLVFIGIVGSVHSITALDLDADGHMDYVAGRSQSSQSGVSNFLSAHYGHGDGSFGPIELLEPQGYASAEFSDLDGDGYVDLLTPGLLVNAGSATGLTGSVSGTPAFQELAVAADFDADGLTDAAGVVSNRLTIFPRDPAVWTTLMHSLADSQGYSSLKGVGSLQPGSLAHLLVKHGPPRSAVFLVLGLGAANLPFHGGVLVPSPDLVVAGLSTDSEGALTLAAPVPAGLGAGTALFAQAWFVEAGGHVGATNAIVGSAQP